MPNARTPNTPYHEGERSVQQRAGVRAQAERLGRIIESEIPDRGRALLADQPFVVAGWRDPDDRVWASWLTGESGLLQVDPHRLHVQADPVDGDPLADHMRDEMWMALLVIDLDSRQRLRVNGTLQTADSGFVVEPREVYPNCPKYIQRRLLSAVADPAPERPQHTAALTGEQQAWIADADTFFIASLHPETGADVSHRGGDPGFITVESDRRLWWPDYPGNNMFNTLGNVVAHPPAGLLFVDFDGGTVLQLTGTGRVVWEDDRLTALNQAERLVEFEISAVREIPGANPLRWDLDAYSPFNPGS
jgi:hypothetical protein